MKNLFKNLLITFLAFLTIAGLFTLLNNPAQESKEISLSQLVEQINQEQISTIIIRGDKLEIYLKNGEKKVATKEIKEDHNPEIDAVYNRWALIFKGPRQEESRYWNPDITDRMNLVWIKKYIQPDLKRAGCKDKPESILDNLKKLVKAMEKSV